MVAFPLCLHCLHQRNDPQDLHHALQIVGQHVQAHLRADLGQGLCQKMCGTHPGLDGSERVFHRFSSNLHLFRLIAGMGLAAVMAAAVQQVWAQATPSRPFPAEVIQTPASEEQRRPIRDRTRSIEIERP